LDDLIDLTVFIAELCDGEPKFLLVAWRGCYYFCCPDTLSSEFLSLFACSSVNRGWRRSLASLHTVNNSYHGQTS
jgi:hypothetical protein